MTPDLVNIYCDESTHLPRDGMPFLTLGAIVCPVSRTREVSARLFDLRKKHDIPYHLEIKWSKVSPGKLAFYQDLVDYFFDDDDLSFRGVVAQKEGLDHARFRQSHDDWYYKMMFLLLGNLIRTDPGCRIYLDKKDTRSGDKVRRLHEILANSTYDFNRARVTRVQIVESCHVNQLQLADLLLGAVNYANRGLSGSPAKQTLVDQIRRRSGFRLTRSTLPNEPKFNLFHWTPRGRE